MPLRLITVYLLMTFISLSLLSTAHFIATGLTSKTEFGCFSLTETPPVLAIRSEGRNEILNTVCKALYDLILFTPAGSSCISFLLSEQHSQSPWTSSLKKACCLLTISLLAWFFLLLLFKNFYWCIFDLQCFISFSCTGKWISYTFTYIHSFLYSFPK